jgi:hypothetical protein
MSGQLASACASSVAAAYHRLANDYVNRLVQSVVNEESDPDDSGFNTHEKHASIDLIEKKTWIFSIQMKHRENRDDADGLPL